MKSGKLLLVFALCAFIASFAFLAPLSAQEKSANPQEKAAKPQEKGVNPMVLVKTSMGNFKIELFQKEAPITVANFLNYVDKKFYDGTIFHRVIPGFVIQGGGFDTKMMSKATLPPIKNEATNGLKNLRGTLSMARTSDINSATSQFFVNLVDNAALDHMSDAQYGYAVFGKVVEGMDVVDKIAAVKTTSKGQHQDVPETAVVVTSMTRIGAKPEAAAPKPAAPGAKKPETTAKPPKK